ncbi:MAG: tetratricopeptide repeat protein [Ardenticatenaceae bacterium]|nr:tetratricopeptide repeat protein [Ardenticatenaceae bacterium]
MKDLKLSLLGNLEIVLDGTSIDGFRSSKAKALLCYLAVTGHPHFRPALAGLLWGDMPEASALRNLTKALSNLRRLVSPQLVITRHTVSINPDSSYWLDVDALQSGVKSYSSSEIADINQLLKAVELYRGDFLEGFYVRNAPDFENWVVDQRERLQKNALETLHTVANHYMQNGKYKEAIKYTTHLLEMAPWQEDAHYQLMLLLAKSGRRSDALTQYNICCRHLEEELGVEPLARTTSLYGQIRDGQFDIKAGNSTREMDAPPFPPSFLTIADESIEQPQTAFVGRESQLKKLNEYFESAANQRGNVVFISGGAGRGKTTLAAEFSRRAQETFPKLVVTTGNCNDFSGNGDPYLPFRDVVSMLAGELESRPASRIITQENALRLWHILPHTIQSLVEHGPSLIDAFFPNGRLLNQVATIFPDETILLNQLEQLANRNKDSVFDLTQQHFFEQYTNVLLAVANRNPMLLILDDLQWMDTASASLLFHLGRRLRNSPILIVGVYRPEEVTLDRAGSRHPLEKVLAEFRRSLGDITIDLDKVSQEENKQFVGSLLDSEPNQFGAGFRKALFDHTGGHPLFTVELLRSLQGRGELVKNEKNEWVEGSNINWNELPAKVDAVIKDRISRLNEDLHQILRTACVEGEVFTAQVVARMQMMEEKELFQRLSMSLNKKHRLVHEQSEIAVGSHILSRYKFTHALIQRYLYHELDTGERRLLHGEIAKVLETLYEEKSDEIAVQLARHFKEAGNTNKAAIYLRQAGEQAARMYANDEAVNYFSQALELTPETNKNERYTLFLAREKVYHLQGAREAQHHDLVVLEGLANILDDNSKLAEVALRQAVYTLATGDFKTTVKRTQEAIKRAQNNQNVNLQARGFLLWGRALLLQGDYEAGQIQLEKALALAKDGKLSLVEASSLQKLGIIAAFQSNYAKAKSFYKQALEIYHSAGERQGEADILSNLGVIFYDLADYLNARDYDEQALAIYQAIGDRWGETIVQSNLGVLYCDLGDYAAARDYHQRALEIRLIIDDHQGEAISLVNLGLVNHLIGENEASRQNCEQALRIQEEIGDRRGQGYSLTYLGLALTGLGKLEAASDAFARAMNLRREIGQMPLAIDDLAGLARVALTQGHNRQAYEHVQEILVWLSEHGQEGIEYPLQVDLTCYEVLMAVGGGETAVRHQARTIFTRMHERLLEKAASIKDETVRQQFLDTNSTNRAILAIWQSQ